MDRFEREDTLGRVTSVISYIKCLDQCSVDVASADGYTEADFRALVHDQDLLEESSVIELFERVAKEINRHLEHGAEAAEKLQRQLTLENEEKSKK